MNNTSPQALKIKSIFLLFALFSFSSSAQVSVIEDSLFSPSINAFCRMNILVPEGYSNGKERYTSLYLLHGFNQDHASWFNSTELVHYAREYRFIIVSFDAQNSWYANSTTKINFNYEDLVIKDLIPFIDKKYSTIPDKQHRAIAGLSMGGYGAVKFGLKYPQQFFYAAGMSPSMQFPAGLEDSAIVARRSAASNQSVREAFGAQRNEQWNANDIFFLLAHANKSSLPYFYLSVGSHDGIPEVIVQAHQLASEFRKRAVPFELHETPGAHDWDFWDKEIEIVLKNISSHLKN